MTGYGKEEPADSTATHPTHVKTWLPNAKDTESRTNELLMQIPVEVGHFSPSSPSRPTTGSRLFQE